MQTQGMPNRGIEIEDVSQERECVWITHVYAWNADATWLELFSVNKMVIAKIQSPNSNNNVHLPSAKAHIHLTSTKQVHTMRYCIRIYPKLRLSLSLSLSHGNLENEVCFPGTDIKPYR